MRRRNYLAGTALGAVTSATALSSGCLDSLETDGTGSGEEEDTDTDDTDTSDVDDSPDDEENEASDDDDTDPVDEEGQDVDGSEQDDGETHDQNGDESRDQDEESEHQGEDESERADEDDESAGAETVEFEVIDMTPSIESGTEFTYIVLAHTDGSESIPGEASLVDETGATVDSASYEAMSGGGSFELTYQAPTVDEETEVALMIETDHGPVNLGSVRVFPSEPSENDDSSGPAENNTENND